MSDSFNCALLVSMMMACGSGGAAPEARSDHLPPAPSPLTTPVAIDASLTPVDDAGQLEGPLVGSDAAPDAALPPVVLTPSKSWPFFQWDRAQAFTFNLERPGPHTKLRIYSEKQGWNVKSRPGPILDAAQSKKAMQLLAQTQGELIVSKCPFPRHGIVFFAGQTPVASISVCFECGDIMIWPAYDPASDWEQQKSRRFGKLMKAYDRVFPKWQSLFETDLGLPTDWTKLAPGAE